MRLSADLISRFQKRYFEVYAVHLLPEEAEIELLELAELIRITMRTQLVSHEALKGGE
jgi:hypothetical protein